MYVVLRPSWKNFLPSISSRTPQLWLRLSVASSPFRSTWLLYCFIFRNRPPSKSRVNYWSRQTSSPRSSRMRNELLNCCWSPNFCKFDNQFFEISAEIGLLIDSLLSSLISEISAFKFENDLFAFHHHLLPRVIYWDGCEQQVSEFFQLIKQAYFRNWWPEDRCFGSHYFHRLRAVIYIALAFIENRLPQIPLSMVRSISPWPIDLAFYISVFRK